MFITKTYQKQVVIRMSKKLTKKEFIEKHAKKPEEIQARIEKMDKRREDFTKDAKEIEANLFEYFDEDDPLVDPVKGKVLAWVKY